MAAAEQQVQGQRQEGQTDGGQETKAQGSETQGPETQGTETQELADLLAGIRQRFEVAFCPMSFNDEKVFQILDVNNMTQYLDRLVQTKALKNPLKDLPLWAKIWPGSFVLETYLRKKVACEGKTMLELGAGCGVLAILASRLGFARIITSDVEDMALRFAKANVLKNNLQDQIDVRHIDVTRPGVCPGLATNLDIIAASELLYLDELHGPILNFLERHLADQGQAVFCTDVARRKPHFAKKAAKRFTVSEVFLPGSFSNRDGEPQKRIYSLLTLQKQV